MAEPESDLLLAAAAAYGLSLSGHQLEKLISYVDLLEKWNRTYNLTAVRKRSEILRRHILESLAILPFLTGSRRLDVGTGAGLPGIPLAIAEPQSAYTLLDSNGKKTRFLSEVKRQLGLSNIELKNVRVEAWHPAQRYDAVMTRAFADLPTTLQKVDHVLGEQGSLFTMSTDSIDDVTSQLPAGARVAGAEKIRVPGRDWSFNLFIIQRAQGANL